MSKPVDEEGGQKEEGVEEQEEEEEEEEDETEEEETEEEETTPPTTPPLEAQPSEQHINAKTKQHSQTTMASAHAEDEFDEIVSVAVYVLFLLLIVWFLLDGKETHRQKAEFRLSF